MIQFFNGKPLVSIRVDLAFILIVKLGSVGFQVYIRLLELAFPYIAYKQCTCYSREVAVKQLHVVQEVVWYGRLFREQYVPLLGVLGLTRKHLVVFFLVSWATHHLESCGKRRKSIIRSRKSRIAWMVNIEEARRKRTGSHMYSYWRSNICSCNWEWILYDLWPSCISVTLLACW